MRIALCAIGRRENLYAIEFVEHYKNLGFDNIFIIDNNHDGEEHFEDVLYDYIKDDFVKIIDARNKTRCQAQEYGKFYNQYGNDYDWIAFFDFDEFLIVKDKTVKEWLSSFPNDCQMVLTNWMTMTDNNLVRYDARPLMERFTEPMEYDKCVQYGFPDNRHVKCIVKGGLGNITFGNPHVPNTPLTAYNASNKRCQNSPFQPIDYETAYIKHFTTKTIEEWMTRKMMVGVPDRSQKTFITSYNDRFFKINETTKEKLDYLKIFNPI